MRAARRVEGSDCRLVHRRLCRHMVADVTVDLAHATVVILLLITEIFSTCC